MTLSGVSPQACMTVTEFLLARVAEDEAAARAAIDPERPGTHWQWVTNETDTVVEHGDLREAMNHQDVSLRTVEEFPTKSGVGDLPAFLVSPVEEMEPGAGEHIARHDPARVLAECAAKRAIIELHFECRWASVPSGCSVCRTLSSIPDTYPCRTVSHLATVYADHPDYRQEWAL